jgi:hypothetical protein
MGLSIVGKQFAIWFWFGFSWIEQIERGPYSPEVEYQSRRAGSRPRFARARLEDVSYSGFGFFLVLRGSSLAHSRDFLWIQEIDGWPSFLPALAFGRMGRLCPFWSLASDSQTKRAPCSRSALCSAFLPMDSVISALQVS